MRRDIALHGELATSEEPELRAHATMLEPLAALAAQRVAAYLPKLRLRVRSGVRSRTAVGGTI